MRTVLHTESSPGLGGQEVRTLTEARWIAERGWRVLLAGQPGAAFTERARQLGIDVVEVPMRGAWDLRAVGRLARLVRDEGVGIGLRRRFQAWRKHPLRRLTIERSLWRRAKEIAGTIKAIDFDKNSAGFLGAAPAQCRDRPFDLAAAQIGRNPDR